MVKTMPRALSTTNPVAYDDDADSVSNALVPVVLMTTTALETRVTVFCHFVSPSTSAVSVVSSEASAIVARGDNALPRMGDVGGLPIESDSSPELGGVLPKTRLNRTPPPRDRADCGATSTLETRFDPKARMGVLMPQGACGMPKRHLT